MKVEIGLPTRDARNNELVAIDIELFGSRQERLHRDNEGTFACMSMTMEDGSYLVEDQKDVHEALKRVKRGVWAIHTATFDLRHLRRWSSVTPEKVWDTMLVERDIFGGWYDRFALADLHRRWNKSYLGKETVEEFAEATTMSQARREYAVMDAVCTFEVAKKQYQYVKDNLGDFRWYWEIDHPMIFTVLDMPPIRIDEIRWRELYEISKAKFEKMKADMPINPRSPDQVKDYMRANYKINLKDTNKKTLELMAKKKPDTAEFLSLVIEARESGKLVSSYGENWLHHVEDGYVYPNVSIVGAETGRMSYSRPGMQQVPVRKSPEYREAVVASDGNVIMVSDVNQQEIRVTTFFSQDDRLLDHLRKGEDTHLAVTRQIYEDDAITRDDPRRVVGKAINLGISYGLSPGGLAKNANISSKEARKILESYFESYPGVKRSQNNFIAQAVKNYYVTTSTGRRVYINPYFRQWQQNALNAPIQGSSADMLKLATVYIHNMEESMGIAHAVNLVVHDEIVQDCPADEVDIRKKITSQAWEEAGAQVIPGIPMVSETVTGKNWRAKG